MQKYYGSNLEGIQSSVIEVLLTDEHLLSVTPHYTLKLIFSMCSYGADLTTQECIKYLKEAGDKTAVSRDEVLRILTENSSSDMIDTSTLVLDGNILRSILSTAAQFSETTDSDGLSIKEALYLNSIPLFSEEINSYRILRNMVSEFGDQINVYGYPGELGDAAVLEAENLLSITTASRYPDGAWECISSMLSADFQKKYSHRTFPLLTGVLEQQVRENKNDNSEAASKLLDKALASVSVGGIQYEEIYKIIKEEGEGYFSEDKTLEDTVKIIQNRAKIYLAEQN